MRDVLNRILNRMSEIVHRVNAPFVPGVVMMHMGYTINNRITHIDVWGCHINFRTQYLFAIHIFAFFHLLKEL